MPLKGRLFLLTALSPFRLVPMGFLLSLNLNMFVRLVTPTLLPLPPLPVRAPQATVFYSNSPSNHEWGTDNIPQNIFNSTPEDGSMHPSAASHSFHTGINHPQGYSEPFVSKRRRLAAKLVCRVGNRPVAYAGVQTEGSHMGSVSPHAHESFSESSSDQAGFLKFQATGFQPEYQHPEFDHIFADCHTSSRLPKARNLPPAEVSRCPTQSQTESFDIKRRKLLSCPSVPHHRGRPPE